MVQLGSASAVNAIKRENIDLLVAMDLSICQLINPVIRCFRETWSLPISTKGIFRFKSLLISLC